MSDESRALPGWLLAMCEVLLACVTFAVVLGFGRVFQGGDFGTGLVTVALTTHVMLAVLRRTGRGVVVSLVASLAGLVLVLTWLWFRDTTVLGLPTGRTLDAARAAGTEAVDLFGAVLAPTPAATGFLIASALGIYVAAFLADWAAFRLWSGIEALVPPLTLFIFCSLLGSEQLRVPATLAFTVTSMAFFVVHRTAKRTLVTRWVTDDRDTGAWTLVRSGLVIAVGVGLLGTLVVGQRLPGAGSNAIVSWRDDGNGPGDRFTISPLVEINARLVDQADVELFTVRSPEPAYWRLTALETFDGSSWRSKGRFTEAEEQLGSAPEAVATHDVTQGYDMKRLGGLWLPTAMIPETLSGDVTASYHEDSSTLIVDSSADTSDGFAYSITSAVPTYTADELRAADTVVPSGIAERYLELPPDFSPIAVAEAERQTQGLENPYMQMLALQNWFQSDEFIYDLDVQAGHSEDAIEAFLETKRGYCEQFAGTFAAMARALGVPSRVAVGFTPGEQDAQDPNLYRVSGLHAHAWPEVWLGQYGWVPFEPTKSRGAPNADAWTGLSPAQADEPASSSTTSVAGGSTPSTSVVPAPTTTLGAGQGQSELDAGPDERDDARDEPEQPADATRRNLVLALVALVVLVLLWVGALQLGARHLRRIDRSAGEVARRAPDEQVRRVWSEALDHLELVGALPYPHETHTEFASREAPSLAGAGSALVTLARTTDLATFAPGYVDAPLADEATGAAQAVIHGVSGQMTNVQRLRALVDPRPVWRQWRRDHR